MRKISAISVFSTTIFLAAVGAFVYLILVRPMLGGATASGEVPASTTEAVELTPTSETTVTPTPTPEPTLTPTATESSPGANLTIHNNSNAVVCYVFVSELHVATGWGDDDLGGDTVIPPGGSFDISGLPFVDHTILVEDCDHNVLALIPSMPFVSGVDEVITITDSPDALLIDNMTNYTICGVYISPPEDDYWGSNWLSDLQNIESGASRRFAVPSGTWDLRAVSCDGEEVERYGEPIIGEEFEWIINE